MNASQPNIPVPASNVESVNEAPSAETGTDPLSDAEKRARDRLLRQYWKLEGAWFDVASILMELRNKRLYRENHPSFEDFCVTELGMTRANVNRWIRSSEVALHLETNVAKPAKEAHIRPLLRLSDRAQQEQCYRAAVESAKVENRSLRASDVTKAVAATLNTNGVPEPGPDTKAVILTRMSRDLIRGLAGYSEDQLQRLEDKVKAVKDAWLAETSPAMAPAPREASKAGGDQ